MFLQRNCILPNAIQSRHAGVCPGVRVGVGVGVDIKTPTPESESTPMKTLSTPQPWLCMTVAIFTTLNKSCILVVIGYLHNAEPEQTENEASAYCPELLEHFARSWSRLR